MSDRTDRLAEIAAQLAGRIRDDDPEAVARWLAAALEVPTCCPGCREYRDLAIVASAAVPMDRPWTELTAWTWLRRPAAIAA